MSRPLVRPSGQARENVPKAFECDASYVRRSRINQENVPKAFECNARFVIRSINEMRKREKGNLSGFEITVKVSYE